MGGNSAKFSEDHLGTGPTTGTITPLIFPEPVEIGCMVEEEVPHLMEDPGKNFVVAKDEDPKINWDECWNEDDAEEHAHPAPNSCRLTEDHLVLIFDMQKDLARAVA
jgi:hypothetical protein